MARTRPSHADRGQKLRGVPKTSNWSVNKPSMQKLPTVTSPTRSISSTSFKSSLSVHMNMYTICVISTCAWICSYVLTYTYTHKYLYVYMYIGMYLHAYTYIYTQTHPHTHTLTLTHTFTYIYKYVHTYGLTCMYLYLFKHIHTYWIHVTVTLCHHPVLTIPYQVQPIAFGVSFLQPQISIDNPVLLVFFITSRWKESNQIETGD